MSAIFGFDRLEDFHHPFAPVGERLDDRVLDLAVEGEVLDAVAGGKQGCHVIGEVGSSVVPAKLHWLDVAPWDPVVGDGGRSPGDALDRVVVVVDARDDVPVADLPSVIVGVAGDDDAFAGDRLAVHGIGAFRSGVTAGVFRSRVTFTTQERSSRFAEGSEFGRLALKEALYAKHWWCRNGRRVSP